MRSNVLWHGVSVVVVAIFVALVLESGSQEPAVMEDAGPSQAHAQPQQQGET